MNVCECIARGLNRTTLFSTLRQCSAVTPRPSDYNIDSPTSDLQGIEGDRTQHEDADRCADGNDAAARADISAVGRAPCSG